MNEIKRLKAWYKKRIENWDDTVMGIGLIGMILYIFAAIVSVIAWQSSIAILFAAGMVTCPLGANFLVHEHEIERNDENLRIFLKKVDKCCRIATIPDYKIEIASHNYQSIPYDMLMKALEDYGFCVKNPSWEPFTLKDYDKGSMLYLYLVRTRNI
ncbi:MAG: hypothetical protein J6W35_08235 [Eubacterium sp.]|nr:hypothetical protein [Eubacterium sp.]